MGGLNFRRFRVLIVCGLFGKKFFVLFKMDVLWFDFVMNCLCLIGRNGVILWVILVILLRSVVFWLLWYLRWYDCWRDLYRGYGCDDLCYFSDVCRCWYVLEWVINLFKFIWILVSVGFLVYLLRCDVLIFININ